MSESRQYDVLFLCTANSARSVMAEAILSMPDINRGRFRAFSAGSHPRGSIHPLALALLQDHGVPTDHLRSKSWDEFARSESPRMDFVITVCEQAAAEVCPLWPGQPVIAHWSVPDPSAVIGDEHHRLQAFVSAFALLKQRIELFASLPLGKLDELAMRAHLKAIGA